MQIMTEPVLNDLPGKTSILDIRELRFFLNGFIPVVPGGTRRNQVGIYTETVKPTATFVTHHCGHCGPQE